MNEIRINLKNLPGKIRKIPDLLQEKFFVKTNVNESGKVTKYTENRKKIRLSLKVKVKIKKKPILKQIRKSKKKIPKSGIPDQFEIFKKNTSTYIRKTGKNPA